MQRFFTDHPATVGETYGEHFAFAVSIGGRMVAGGLACMLHAVLPEFCKTTGSRTIRELALRLVPTNRDKRKAAARLACFHFTGPAVILHLKLAQRVVRRRRIRGGSDGQESQRASRQASSAVG